MSDVKRIYVEKRTAYATEANEIKHNLIEQLGLEIDTLRIIKRYDVQGWHFKTRNQHYLG